MKNVSHKKGWNLGMTQEHVEPSPITLTKGTYNRKLETHVRSGPNQSYIFEYGWEFLSPSSKWR